MKISITHIVSASLLLVTTSSEAKFTGSLGVRVPAHFVWECQDAATDACAGSAITNRDCERACSCNAEGNLIECKAFGGCSANLVQLFCEGFTDEDPNCNCVDENAGGPP